MYARWISPQRSIAKIQRRWSDISIRLLAASFLLALASCTTFAMSARKLVVISFTYTLSASLRSMSYSFAKRSSTLLLLPLGLALLSLLFNSWHRSGFVNAIAFFFKIFSSNPFFKHSTDVISILFGIASCKPLANKNIYGITLSGSTLHWSSMYWRTLVVSPVVPSTLVPSSGGESKESGLSDPLLLEEWLRRNAGELKSMVVFMFHKMFLYYGEKGKME